HIVLDLGHVLLGRGLLGERPGQHELRLEYGLGSLYDPVEGCCHPRDCRVLDEALHVADVPARVALVPDSIELFGCRPELDNQVPGQALWVGLTAFLAPETDERRLIVANDDAGIRTTDEET